MNYQIGKVHINSHTREIRVSGLPKPLRPKTTEVLLYLVSNRDRVVTKDELLRTIWHDVVTQEYVLYQSVNEIRSFFPDEQVVRTFPRQGYQWIVPTTEYLPADSMRVERPDFRMPFARVALVLLAMTALVFYGVDTRRILPFDAASLSPAVVAGERRIIVHPVFDATVAGNTDAGALSPDHTEALAEYIELIPNVRLQSVLPAQPQDLPAVLLTEITTTADPAMAGNANAFSLHTRLYRQMDEYRLHYVLLNASSMRRGVIFNSSAEALFSELASDLGQLIGGNTGTNAQETLAGEALFLGMEAFVQQDYAVAETFLHTAAILNPEELTSWRYLSKSQIFQGKFGLASETIREVLSTTTFSPRNGFELQLLNQLKAIANPVPVPQASQADAGTA